MSMSVLATDGYKFSMAEAGWPLRTETFYYTHRKGGLQVLPVDIASWVKGLLPRAEPGDYEYLARVGYEMGAGFKVAIGLHDRLQIDAIPRGACFFEREPVFSLTGPSALVSWLEPLLLQLHFRIQVATQAVLNPRGLGEALKHLTCPSVEAIVRETLDSVGVKAPPMEVRTQDYHDRVKEVVTRLVTIVESPDRIFEVGMRAAVTMEEHAIALQAMKEAGVRRTSNVLLARDLDLIPVGTMGHEHVQRYGSDREAFRAMKERRPGRSSFLLDTFDTFLSGIPAALDVMRDCGSPGDSIRYDSGDKVSQYLFAVSRSRAAGLNPVHILEDSFDAEQTQRFEDLRRTVGGSPAEQIYGYGGYIVARPTGCPFTRDRVSAVWKLTRSGPDPTMKFGDEPGGGKESIPGCPVVFRRVPARRGPIGMVGQDGEDPPEGYFRLTGSLEEGPMEFPAYVEDGDRRLVLSEATQALVTRLRAEHSGRGLS